ncbi:MAG: phosphomannomutase/phosphoglucomutase [Methylococcaceae bacterium]|jgi:phosphomannomutase/phosphoglucomutase
MKKKTIRGIFSSIFKRKLETKVQDKLAVQPALEEEYDPLMGFFDASVDFAGSDLDAPEKSSPSLDSLDEWDMAGFFDASVYASLRQAQAQTLLGITPKDQAPELVSDYPDPGLSTNHLSRVADPPSIFTMEAIQGIAGQSLTEEMLYDIGRALGSEAKKHNITKLVLGRDGRAASEGLAVALANGLAAVGCNVLDIGRVPTPLLYFVAQHIEGRSGVMVGASHKLPDYNAIKMMLAGEILHGESILQLKQIIDQQHYAAHGLGKIEQNYGVVYEYIGTIVDSISMGKPMTIVVDYSHGVVGELGTTLFKGLGCRLIELNQAVDGSFPQPLADLSMPEHSSELVAAVKHHKADLGIAFSGDGSQLGVLDADGKAISAEQLLLVCAKDALASKPGAGIIYDVTYSRHSALQITKLGGRPIMWKTGLHAMRAKLKETGALLAAESSGRLYFNDRWFGFDDGLYYAARLLEVLSNNKPSSTEVFAQFRQNEINEQCCISLAEGENTQLLGRMQEQAVFVNGRVSRIDGVRVDFSTGWGAVLALSYEPSLQIRFGADNTEQLKEIQAQFKQVMQAINPGLHLPF